MDRKPAVPQIRRTTWQPQTRLDRLMASALRRLYTRLQAGTCTVYLPTEDGKALAAAMTVNTTLSFTITPGMAVDDLRFSAPRAHQSGELVVFDETDLERLTRTSAAALLHSAYGMLIVSAPVRTPRHRFGVVSMRLVPPRPLDEEARGDLQAIADELAAGMELLAQQGEAVVAPSVPLFIAVPNGTPLRAAAAPQPDPGEADQGGQDREELTDSAAVSNAYLYQLQRLSSILTATTHVRDVIAAAQEQIVIPFGGRAVMLCLSRAGRLHVVGSAGFSRQAVQRVAGTLLSRHTPETDTLTRGGFRFFSTSQELRQSYPALDQDPECQARAYVPLISQDRAVGCGVLEFPEPADRPSPEDIAVLMLMMGQAGQALERAYSYESEHALTQTVQRSLLPRRLPHVPQVVTTARYLSATEGVEMGGDWYDVVALPDGGIGLVVGDVEGHTLEAVGVMAQLRSGVRAYAAEGHEPGSVLERSNRLLVGLDTDLYATCCCMWLDLATGLACAATAGHPGPLISNADGQLVPVPMVAGPPLGIASHPVYQEGEIRLEPGAVAALYTDGLLATRRLDVDDATAQLGGLLLDYRSENLETLADHLVEGCRSRTLSDDDAALLLMRYEGTQPGLSPRVARTSVRRHDLQGVARVRQFLGELSTRWDMAPLRDDLELLASEIVTNALIHAHSDVDLRLRAYPDRIRIEVRDSDPHPPVPTAVLSSDVASNQAAESGRGLLIVDALAAEWGSSPAGRGKTTWCEIAIA